MSKTKSLHGNTDRFDLLVCGKTGVGKSTLINFLIGKEVFKVGDAAEVDEDDALNPMTMTVGRHDISINSVLLRIFDSPGLQDGTSNDRVYVQDMYDKCKNADLVFYCLEANVPRWLPNELAALQVLTEKFGSDFWKKTVLVLTKANLVEPRGSGDKGEYLAKIVTALHTKFQKELTKPDVAVPSVIATDVPVAAAGSERVQVLADGKPFISKLWLASLHRLQSDKQEVFFRATSLINRLIPASPDFMATISRQVPHEEYAAKCKEKREMWEGNISEPPPPYLQVYPIPLEKDEILDTAAAVGIATGTTALTAASGAGIGALVGVVGGPLGVAIGALAGGAIGAFAGLLSTLPPLFDD